MSRLKISAVTFLSVWWLGWLLALWPQINKTLWHSCFTLKVSFFSWFCKHVPLCESLLVCFDFYCLQGIDRCLPWPWFSCSFPAGILFPALAWCGMILCYLLALDLEAHPDWIRVRYPGVADMLCVLIGEISLVNWILLLLLLSFSFPVSPSSDQV